MAAMQTFLDRGIKTAESLFSIHRVLTTKHENELYQSEKKHIFSRLSTRIRRCPALQNSGWVLIGILIVDACVKRSGLRDEDRLEEWSVKVDTLAAAALGGGTVAASLLRAGDMKILRSFFNR